MRQSLEIMVMTSVDVDSWLPDQRKNERELQSKVAEFVAKLTDDTDVMVDLEYGEPV